MSEKLTPEQAIAAIRSWAKAEDMSIGARHAQSRWHAVADALEPAQSDLEQLRARIAELDPPWVRIEDGLPPDPYSWDIALRDGSVRTNLAWDRYYEFFHDGGPNAWTSEEVSHYRRRTPPKHPESK